MSESKTLLGENVTDEGGFNESLVCATYDDSEKTFFIS